MKSRDEQIAALKGKFDPPTTFRISPHLDKNGIILSCCQTVSTQFRGTVKAVFDANGICGVIEYVTKKFHWGCIPCTSFCECFKYADHMYCTATMGIGLEALRLCQESSDGNVSFQLVAVEQISVFGRGNVDTWRRELAKTAKKYSDRPIHKDWLLEDTSYHNLLGIVDKEGNLTLCDYDGKFFFPRDVTDDEASTVSLRVTHWQGCASLALGAPALRQVTWGGLPLTLGQWEDITPQRVPAALSREDQVAQVALAFTSSRQEVSPVSAQQSFCLTPTTATTTESSPTGSSNALWGTDATHAPLSLLITGIYMGSNPCPGVGVARAVRATLPDAHIVAADNFTASDSAFSEARKIEELGNMVATAGECKQRQWDIVAGLLQELKDKKHPDDDASNELSVFYIPVGLY
jgi:hypothetical protein